MAGFTFPSYVNEVRRALNAADGSVAREYSAADFGNGTPKEDGCAMVFAGDTLTFSYEGEILRVILRGFDADNRGYVAVDGVSIYEGPFPAGDNTWKVIPALTEKGAHTVTVVCEAGKLGVYRMESYEGSTAAINAGVGSCPSSRYLTEYFERYVRAYRPHTVVMEAHTINDWLSGMTPDQCEESMYALICAVKELGATPIYMSVEPIFGDQINALGENYQSYVDAGYRAAERAGCKIIDTNRLMNEMLAGLTPEEQFALLFNDRWHPNDRGHKIYAEEILKVLIS